MARSAPLFALGGLLGLAATLAVAAPLPDHARRAAAQANAAPCLDGIWTYESQVIGGWDITKRVRDEGWIEIKGASFCRCGKVGPPHESKLILHPWYTPPSFELEFRHPLTGKIHITKGIYDFDGDTLKLCYDNTGKRRPKKFESPGGKDSIVLSVLKRKKP